jgi:rubrerythrin
MSEVRTPILVRAAGSRRLVISGGALAAAGGMPALFGLDAAAKKDDKKGKGKGKSKGNNRGGTGDTKILNYALTLEHLEYAFYRDGLALFGAGDFDAGVFANLQVIRDHEDTHVDALSATIDQRGGNPVAEGCYDFGFDDPGFGPDDFLGIAQALENTGVMAYTGVLAKIMNPGLQTTGATIATVEARHASYLNFLNGDNPFPDAFDMPKSMEEILQIAGQFIVACAP